MRLSKLSLIAAMSFGLVGCGAEVGAIAAASYLVAENVSVVGTDKTIADNVYSTLSGQDCSTIRAIDGDYYCRQRLPDNRIVETKLYCYKTLARVDCYDQPRPYMRNQQMAPASHMVGARSDRIAR